ncbi:triggering receptor expressed on myeloid cells 1 [Camelus dromedarius]|uniref:Triggering receptor expressed on myeloid cells 1 n=2 Tax=Camelus TaxID=9836 RepID=A0A8B6YM99_CAMFR|nr:triggering receptor expressed on myeloid cells 1 [Camelus ferus]XP_010972017.1 triggering receptor expressed on myeloid cells 1 [Camelus bactrianus]
MRRTRLRGLLWVLFVAEIQAATVPDEEEFILAEGQTLEVSCPVTLHTYSNSRKAWQRVKDKGEVQTLALTQRVSGEFSEVQNGRYFLKDIPSEGILHVRMTDLRVEDSGLYRCVIYLNSENSITLFHPIRLVVTKNPSGTPASDDRTTQIVTPTPTRPPFITEAWSKLPTSPTAVTRLPSLSTASLSSPGLGVTLTNVTDVPRVSRISIVIPVVCGLLSKSLVFIVLFAVTQRSFAP